MRAAAIRVMALDAVAAANPGVPMGMADVATVQFSKHL
jgi:transketolase